MKLYSSLSSAALLVAASAAFAQPAAIDLGEFPVGTMRTESTPITGPAVVWYQFTLAQPVSLASLRFLDIDTVGSTPLDTELGLYSSAGNLVATDDDDAEGTRSALSFGSGSDAPAGTGGVVSNGRDGTLEPGTYYLAVGLFNSVFNAAEFSVTGGGTSTGTVTINFNLQNFTPPAPPTATDLGTLNNVDTRMVTAEPLAANEIRWFQVQVPEATVAAGRFFDIDTEGSLLSPSNDTRIALYNSIGRVVASDSDDGSALLSQLTFGQTTPARPAVGNGLAYNGRDGSLPAGTYYIAVGGGTTSAVVFNSGFSATSTAANSGTFNLNLATGQGQTNPSISVGFTPNVVNNCGSASTLITATVTPGTNPTSTGVDVTADLTSLGGNAAAILLDNGTNGDVTAGDNIYSLSFTIGATANTGPVPVVFTVQDDEGRSATSTVTINVAACPPSNTWFETGNGGQDSGQLPATAQAVVASTPNQPLARIQGVLTDGADVDMYRIEICDVANFSASTFPNTFYDTQIFLFNNQGVGVAFNDDIPDGNPGDATTQSRVSATFVTAPGEYYIAVSRYDADPQAGTADIWSDTPFGTERAPDGAGAANPVTSWTTTTSAAGEYGIALTGACYISTPSTCAWEADGCFADYNNDDGIDGDDVIAFFGDWDQSNPCADVDNSDGVDGDDVILFFASWDVSGTGFPGC